MKAIFSFFFFSALISQTSYAQLAEVEWTITAAKVLESNDATLKEAGIKILKLVFTGGSCDMMPYKAQAVNVVKMSEELTEIDVIPQNNEQASEGSGLSLPMCGEVTLVAMANVTDGFYNIKLNGFQQAALIIKGYSFKVVK